ncbi:MAG: phosphoheptose isomerase [Planctomycetota bacterium]|nr:MAG: phosphoheptose isomerase [Planctomycetota bacterium]
MLENVKQSFNGLFNAVETFINDEENLKKVDEIGALFAKKFEAGNKILIAGNGGSLCDAIHFAEEFTGRYRKNRKPLPVIALADNAHITCTANDYGVEYIFSRMVEAYGKDEDSFIGISTSGNSENIIKAFESAKNQGLYTVALLGKDGGKLKGIADTEWIIPAETSDRIQEIHMAILHILIEVVERHMFPENY